MKSYEEVTRDLLKRRNEYEEAQTRRQRTVLRAAVPVCSVALAAAMGVGVWKSGVFEKPPVMGESGNSGVSAAGQLVSPDDPHANDKIVINKPETVGSSLSLDIDLRSDDFIEMSYDEMLEYYGAELEPDVPEDLKHEQDERYGIWKRNGEIYHDNNGLRYYNEDVTRDVHVEAAKGRLPVTCVVFVDDHKEKSYIRDVEIMMVKIGKESYSAEFMVRDVGFRINTFGLSEEEFIDVVKSIIEKNK